MLVNDAVTPTDRKVDSRCLGFASRQLLELYSELGHERLEREPQQWQHEQQQQDERQQSPLRPVPGRLSSMLLVVLTYTKSV